MNNQLPSNKKFGTLFIAVFCALAVYGYIKHGVSLTSGIYLLLSLFFLVATIFDLSVLTPLNKGWFLLGQVLGKVVSPIVLGVIFFLVITPVGLISRLLGRDVLKLRRPESDTYWVEPVGSNTDSESFKNQF